MIVRLSSTRRRASGLWKAIGLTLTGLALAAFPANAQTVSTAISFPTTIQGAQSGVILGDDGFLYGTAYATGSIYKVQPDGTAFEIIYSFSAPNGSGVNTDGQYPARELVAPGDGYLYGTCTNGGGNGLGTVYRVHLDGSGFETLHSFSAEDSSFDNTDGANPLSGLTVNGDGYFYGTTNAGGSDGEGTVYRLSADGATFQVLHDFTFGNVADGSNVYAPLLWGSDGYFYGTTKSGGAHYFGTVYRIKADGTGFQLLHSFTSAEGGSFTALTRGLDSRVYGVSFQGGANLNGLLWGLNTDGTNFVGVHEFSAETSGRNTDGAGPDGALAVGPDGSLYGTTETGGAGGNGVVFKVNPDGSSFASLASFGAAVGDPSTPFGSLERIGNAIYGTTPYGGVNGFGTVFQIGSLPISKHTQILWNNVNGQASLWNVNSDNTFTNHQYGPYSGWTAKAVSDAPDGTTHLLWTNTNGTAVVWNVATNGAFTQHAFGPFSGWKAVSLSTSPGGVTHLLWDKSDGTASLWTLNTSAGTFTQVSYGPYSGWTANQVADGPHVTDLLWNNVNGAAYGWRLNSNGLVNKSFGPYRGWNAASLSVGSDDGAHLLWDNTSGQIALWNVNFATGAFTQTAYGPFSGWVAKAIATGPDNVTHILWNHASDKQVSLWNVGSSTTNHEYGPFTGWTAVAVSAGP